MASNYTHVINDIILQLKLPELNRKFDKFVVNTK